jgi:predicted XRE-type DNA-binding protein
MLEIWKSIEGYDGYDVSNFGRVRSYHSNYGTIKKEPLRILKPGLKKNGYFQVVLFKIIGGKRIRTSILVHKLVAEAFIGKRPEYKNIAICHNDGNKTNNADTNLRYDTYANNMADAVRHGSIKKESNVSTSKLSRQQVMQILDLYKTNNYSQRKLAIMFGVSKTNIGNIIKRKTWKSIPEDYK